MFTSLPLSVQADEVTADMIVFKTFSLLWVLLWSIAFDLSQPLTKDFILFCLFRAAPTAYGGSQARGPIGAITAALHHNHSNAGSEPYPKATPQLTATPDPQPTGPGQGLNLQPHGSKTDLFPLCHNRNSRFYYYFFLWPHQWHMKFRGGIRAAAASLCHSHRNTRFELWLWPIPQLTATRDPQPTEQGQGLNMCPHGY